MENRELTNEEFNLIEKIRSFKTDQLRELTCPCCSRKAKVYKRQFDNTYVLFLISLIHLRKTDFKLSKTVPYFRVIDYCVKTYNRRVSDYSLLEKWNLICNDDGNIWLSPQGFEFMRGLLEISEILYIRDNKIIQQSEKKVRISDFLTGHNLTKNNGNIILKENENTI